MRKMNFFLIFLGLMTASAMAGSESLAAAREETDEEKALFTGVKFQQGNTTLVDGTELGLHPSAPYGSELEADDLSQFERDVFSVSDASGTFTMSQRPRKNEALGDTAPQTGSGAGVVFSERKGVSKTKTHITAYRGSTHES